MKFQKKIELATIFGGYQIILNLLMITQNGKLKYHFINL